MRTDTQAQRDVREVVTLLAAERGIPEERVLAQLIVGHIDRSLEDGIAEMAQQWHMTGPELRQLMADYGLEGGGDAQA